ncbi:MAG: NAD(P)/FAD-dependent oxidoreductase [Armatimonadota bacterium]|nr:NAD(P)/FAD-dependent oxidoreductase [Armatimonadota bacterium]
MESRYDYVLLGGGTSCGYAARGIRELDKTGSIAIISADSEPPYDRPPFSKGFLKNDTMEVADAHSNEDSFYLESSIDVELNRRASSLDLAAKRVGLEGGDTVEYGKLLYALGSEPRRLQIPGGEKMWTLRTAADGVRIRDAGQAGKRAVLIGGGYIGTEVAASLLSRGVEVTIIETEERLLRFFPESMSAAVQEQIESMGGKVNTGDAIASIDANGFVTTKNGVQIESDMVIEGVGVQARLDLGKAAGLEMGEHGLVADATLRSSDPSVWLAGDVVEYPDPIMERPFRAEHHMHATWTGEHAGRAMGGAMAEFRKVPYFFSDIGPLSMILRGDPEASGRIFEFGDQLTPRLTEVVLREDGRLAKFTDLRKEWSEQEPLVDLAERLIEGNVPLEPMANAMGQKDFDPTRLGELLT